jgi:O-antigen/teichoic acid export membrane protein
MKFVHAGAIYALANVASAAVPFLLLPLLTRMLGPAEFGAVVNFALLVTLCMTVAGMNAHAALGVAWFKQERAEMDTFIAAALVLAGVSTSAVALLIALVLYARPQLAPGISPAWGAAAALTAGANVVLQCRLVLWQSQNKPVQNALLQFSASVLNVALSLIAVVVLGWGGAGRNAGFAAAMVVMALTSITLFVAAREVRWQWRGAHLRLLLVFGAPLIAHSLAGVLLSTADRWMVSIELGTFALGIYGAGAQLGAVMAILADAFVKAYGPWLYARLASAREEDRLCAVGAVYSAMPMFIVVALVLGAALYWASSVVLGPQYRAATQVLPWFMLGGAFNGVYVCTSVLYFFSGRTVLLAVVTSTAALCGMAVTWYLVQVHGVIGAAAGYMTTQALLAVLCGFVAFNSFDLPWRHPARALATWARVALGRAPANV